MIPTISITIILIILAGIILFSVLKSVLKATLSLLFLIFVALIVIGFMFVQDVNDFKDTYTQEPSIYILEHEDVLITAFSMNKLNVSTFKPVSVDDASNYFLDEGPGKIFVMNKEILNHSADDEIFNLTGYNFEDALSSDSNNIRASAFVVAFIATVEEHNKMYLVKQIRNDKMIILPRTFAVKVVTFDAKGYLEKIKNIIDNQKGNVANVVNGTKSAFNETKNVLNDTL